MLFVEKVRRGEWEEGKENEASWMGKPLAQGMELFFNGAEDLGWPGGGQGGLAWFVRLGQLQVSIQINKQAGQQVPRCTYSGVVEGRPVDKDVGLGMV